MKRITVGAKLAIGAAALACAALVSADAFAQKRSAAETAAHGEKVSRPLFQKDSMAGQDRTGTAGGMPASNMSSHQRGGMGAAMSRQDVMALQTALNRDGANLKVDGKMGKKTRAALMSYQARNDLAVSGRMDSDTRAKLGM